MSEPEPYEKFGLSFRSMLAAVSRLKGRETHRPGELSYAQLGLLFRLAESGPLPAGELAGLADLSAPTTTQMLEGLARAGVVERIRSDADKRVVLSSLTERGRELVESRQALMDTRWRAALAEFSDDQLLAAAAMLERIRELFDDLAEQPVVEPAATFSA
jgi:DNA-binding MarR family transcriptional regulator